MLVFDLLSFARALLPEPETRSTGEFLLGQQGKFENQLRANSAIAARGVPLPTPREQGLHPRGCAPEEAYLDFAFRAGEDPFPELAEFQVRVTGALLTSKALIELEDHWRIDTDKFSTGPAEVGQAREPHPLFHFQRGGHAQDDFSASSNFIPGGEADVSGDFRGLMQYPGPRVPCLPFDPILAIDFCISQANGLVWRRLRGEPEYLTPVENAQSRVWLPILNATNQAQIRQKWLGPSLLV